MVQFIDFSPFQTISSIERDFVITGGSNFLSNVVPIESSQYPPPYFSKGIRNFSLKTATPISMSSMYVHRPYINMSSLQTRSI